MSRLRSAALLHIQFGIIVPNMSSEPLSASDQSNHASARVRSMLERVLVPLVRVLVRHHVSFNTFSDIAKQAYVRVTTDEFGLSGRPASKSRVALLTGINRRDVSRIQADADAADSLEMFGPAFRLVSRWIRGDNYQDEHGDPRAIPLEGPAPSFAALVADCCPDVPATAVLRELLHSGVCMQTDAATPLLELQQVGYVPREDVAAKLDLLGTDVAALLSTISHNISEPDAPLFQRKVSFPQLSPAGIQALLRVASSDGQDLLRRLDKQLAPLQSDDASGRFAGLGIYAFVEDADTDGDFGTTRTSDTSLD